MPEKMKIFQVVYPSFNGQQVGLYWGFDKHLTEAEKKSYKTIAVGAVTDGKKIFCGYRTAAPRNVLVPPMGKKKPSESIYETVSREFDEETGVVDSVFPGYMGTIVDTKYKTVMHVFLGLPDWHGSIKESTKELKGIRSRNLDWVRSRRKTTPAMRAMIDGIKIYFDENASAVYRTARGSPGFFARV